MRKTYILLVFILSLFACTNNQREENSTEIAKEVSILKTDSQTLELKIFWEFEVEAQKVFDAFTQAEDMKVWWTPSTTFDMNLEVGAPWTITRTEGEAIYTATGKYLEIAAPHRLRYTYTMPQFSPNTDTISIDINTNQKGSTLTYTVSGPDIANELASTPRDSMSQSEYGWRMAFELMEEAWKK